MALTHTALQALKPRDKNFAVTDRDGLYIDVLTSGSMVWRYKYYFNGKREKLTIGRYPQIGLAKARELRAEAAAQLAIGESPAQAKQRDKVERKIEAARSDSFEELARRWFAHDVADKSESWQYSVNNWLKLDILPALGRKAPQAITEDDIEAVVAKVVDRGSPSSAAKVRAICGHIFAFGIAKRELAHNPVSRVMVPKAPPVQSHRPLEIQEVGPFLTALDAVDARPCNKIAIQILMHTFTRKDELRLAKRTEFDLPNRVWTIPAHRMKMRDPHLVFLSRQVVELVGALFILAGKSEYVLPHFSSNSKPIGHTTLNNVIDRLDIDGARFVPHGFRATASTWLNEAGFRYDVIERQLAHRERNKVRATYNRAEYAEERREMLEWWSDYLDMLKAGQIVPPMNARRAALRAS